MKEPSKAQKPPVPAQPDALDALAHEPVHEAASRVQGVGHGDEHAVAAAGPEHVAHLGVEG